MSLPPLRQAPTMNRLPGFYYLCVMPEGDKNDKNKKPKELSFLENIKNRKDISDAIVDFLIGRSVQECIDTLDAAKRKILDKAVL